MLLFLLSMYQNFNTNKITQDINIFKISFSQEGKILGIDSGKKKIGIAISDSLKRIALTHKTIYRKKLAIDLMNIDSSNDSKYKDTNFINWFKQWESRVLINNGSIEKSINLMKKNNPIVIPRNHKVEEALEAAKNNDLSLTNKLLSILNKPYDNQNDIDDYQSPSSNSEYQTFCGT